MADKFTYAQARAKCRALGIPEDRKGLAEAFRILGRERRRSMRKHERISQNLSDIKNEKERWKAMNID